MTQQQTKGVESFDITDFAVIAEFKGGKQERLLTPESFQKELSNLVYKYKDSIKVVKGAPAEVHIKMGGLEHY